MSDPPVVPSSERTCASCRFSNGIPGYETCGYDPHPITGLHQDLCSTQRMMWMRDNTRASMEADNLNQCGPQGRFWEAYVGPPKKKHWLFRPMRLSMQ